MRTAHIFILLLSCYKIEVAIKNQSLHQPLHYLSIYCKVSKHKLHQCKLSSLRYHSLLNNVKSERYWYWSCGAMVARLTPDQKAACSSHVGIMWQTFCCTIFLFYCFKFDILWIWSHQANICLYCHVLKTSLSVVFFLKQ